VHCWNFAWKKAVEKIFDGVYNVVNYEEKRELMSEKEAKGLNEVYEVVCSAIGFENTKKIYQLFSGSQINFPTRLYSREYVLNEAKKIYDGSTESINLIATRFRYSERTVRKMLKADSETIILDQNARKNNEDKTVLIEYKKHI
jgi:hypothetical protein